jgi:hypothetical protein
MADTQTINTGFGRYLFLIDAEWFLNVRELTVPKTLDSLEALWQEMYPKQTGLLEEQLSTLIDSSAKAFSDPHEVRRSTSIILCLHLLFL